MGSFLNIARVLLTCLLVSAVVADNACQNPSVRREWRKFTPGEQTEWIRAVKCLTALPHDPKLSPSVPADESLIPSINETSSFFDDIVYLHMDLSVKIHNTGQFFPWHRFYVQYFEDVLTERCGYTGTTPYWDWTQDAHDVYNSNFWDNSSSGIGGWGDPANDYQISTGGFKDMIVAYPTPHHIRRNFTLFPFAGFMINTTMTEQNVDFLVNNYEEDFIGFQTYLESIAGAHLGAHIIVNGDMSGTCPNGAVPPACYRGPKWAVNDPIFFMHHAMVDKIWYDWQKKCLGNKYAYGGGSVQTTSNSANFTTFPTGYPPYLNFGSQIPGDGLWSNVTIWDVMDTTGGALCYVYV